MRRLFIGAAALALGLAVPSQKAEAQFFVNASATLPMGDYGDYAKTGWLAGLGARAWANSTGKLALWVVGEYGSNSHDDEDDAKTNIMSGGAWLAYILGNNPEASVTPFVVWGGGYMNHQYKIGDLSENYGQAFAGGGIGASFGSEGKGPWVLASYRYGFDETTFLALGGGWTF